MNNEYLRTRVVQVFENAVDPVDECCTVYRVYHGVDDSLSFASGPWPHTQVPSSKISLQGTGGADGNGAHIEALKSFIEIQGVRWVHQTP